MNIYTKLIIGCYNQPIIGGSVHTARGTFLKPGCVSCATLELAKQQPSLSYTSLISLHESCAFDDEFHATAEREPLQHPAFSKSSSAELQVLTTQRHVNQQTTQQQTLTLVGSQQSRVGLQSPKLLV